MRLAAGGWLLAIGCWLLAIAPSSVLRLLAAGTPNYTVLFFH